MSKFFAGFILAIVVIILAYINYGLYYQPTFTKIESKEISTDLIGELRFLKASLKEGADKDMQAIYPEGFVFMNALYGLSWCAIANSATPSSDLYTEAHHEIESAYEKIESEDGRRIFDEDLILPYGAFYNGWSNYLLGKKLSVEDSITRNPNEVNAFKSRCAQIASAIKKESSPYLESYRYSAWPADGMVCLASLALHDKLFEPAYQDVLQQCLTNVKTHLDSDGLIPHSVQAHSGKVEESARGSSQSLMLIFLLDIDQQFARDQYKIYKELFLDSRLGLPGIREYPKGTFGMGDIDSGPVIFQMGGAATIVGLHTMTRYGESSVSVGLRNVIEAFGISTHDDDQKKYLLGQLPMADAFIAWSHSAAIQKENTDDLDFSWRTRFQLYSLLLLCPFILLAFFVFRRPR